MVPLDELHLAVESWAMSHNKVGRVLVCVIDENDALIARPRCQSTQVGDELRPVREWHSAKAVMGNGGVVALLDALWPEAPPSVRKYARMAATFLKVLPKGDGS